MKPRAGPSGHEGGVQGPGIQRAAVLGESHDARRICPVMHMEHTGRIDNHAQGQRSVFPGARPFSPHGTHKVPHAVEVPNLRNLAVEDINPAPKVLSHSRDLAEDQMDRPIQDSDPQILPEPHLS